MRRRITTLLGLVTAMVASTAVFSAPASHASTTDQFTVPFSGDQVVPGPGDPDGDGGVFVALGRNTGSFCFFADTANISTPLTVVHLHRGLRGQVGEVILDLHGPSNDPDVSGCFNPGRELVRDIMKHLDNYYIDYHSEEFPGGALRAQLG
jgi:hypothetical protein